MKPCTGKIFTLSCEALGLARIIVAIYFQRRRSKYPNMELLGIKCSNHNGIWEH